MLNVLRETLFEEGNILLFSPYVFKNSAEPKDKFFLILKKEEDKNIIYSLPSSKDFVPATIQRCHGCIDKKEARFNCFCFLSGRNIATNKETEKPFHFNKDTFLYGSQLNEYSVDEILKRHATSQIKYIGTLDENLRTRLCKCFRKSTTVKNKFRKRL